LSALADTSVLVEYLRGVDQARQLLRPAIARGEVVTASVLTRVELLTGMPPETGHRTEALIAAIHWLPLDGAVVDEADSLARRFGRSHSEIDAVDYCVAASARVHGLDLWTLDIERFPMFEGLRAAW